MNTIARPVTAGARERYDHVLYRLGKVTKSGTGHTARCPAHDDRRNSLSLATGKEGRILLKCHAGCSVVDVCKALGIRLSFLMPEEPSSRIHGGEGVAEAVYDYVDEDGKTLFQVRRYPGKQFRQFRFEGGAYRPGLKQTRRVLYKLPAVIRAAGAGSTVFIVEGEKDVATLNRLGMVATCNPMGAGKWRAAYSASLKGAHVVILPDNDRTGKLHAQKVARSVHQHAATVKIVELPGLPPKGDVTDWVEAGNDREALLRIVEATEALSESPELFEDEEEQLPVIPPQVFEGLPPLLREGTSFFETTHERDVYLLGALATLSASLPNVRFLYGKRLHSPHLYAFVVARAGEGKGVLSHAFHLLDPLDALIRKRWKEDLDAWREEKDAYEENRRRRKGKVDLSHPGDPPPERFLHAGEDTSLASLMEGLQDNPEGLFVASTEADALSNANRQDYGGFSHLLRKAFHHEPANRRMKSFKARVPQPRLACVISGTHAQLPRLVESIEDGLYSRFALFAFQAPLAYESQRPSDNDRAFVAWSAEAGRRVLKLWRLLHEREGPLYFKVPAALWAKVDAAYEALFRQVMHVPAPPLALKATIYRGALISFRIAMVLCLYRLFEEGTDLSHAENVTASSRDIDAALLLGLTFTEQGLRLASSIAGDHPGVADHRWKGRQPITAKGRRLYEALPSGRFETATLLRVGLEDVGLSRSRVFSNADRLIEHGLFIKHGQGDYEKVSLENETTRLRDNETLGPNTPKNGENLEVSKSRSCETFGHNTQNEGEEDGSFDLTAGF